MRPLTVLTGPEATWFRAKKARTKRGIKMGMFGVPILYSMGHVAWREDGTILDVAIDLDVLDCIRRNGR